MRKTARRNRSAFVFFEEGAVTWGREQVVAWERESGSRRVGEEEGSCIKLCVPTYHENPPSRRNVY